ncbi:MAG TPA: GSCFA domain-containing protein [Fibrella sp.]
MQFRTELTPERLPVQMQLSDRIVTVGSCFAEVMGGRLADHKLAVVNNPLGTLFNPFSISKLLTLAVNGGQLDEAHYAQRDGLWFHYDAHSSIWGHSKPELADTFARRLAELGDELRRADWLLLTLGSAVVYEHRETGQVVANCHKMPGTLFDKYLLQIDPVRTELAGLLHLLRNHNPGLRIVLTVSPVRHIRDGLTLNSASKALLRTLCAELSGTFPAVHYFPAYELIQDDLRDYRFYEADLIHPNAQAHDYVFAKFAECAFTPDLCGFIKQWQQIRRAMAHRPLHGPTDTYRQFLQKLVQQIDALPAGIDTTAERAEILNRLAIN